MKSLHTRVLPSSLRTCSEPGPLNRSTPAPLSKEHEPTFAKLTWVCPQCGDASFDPDVAQKVLDTARELAAIARKARTSKPELKELVIKVA